MISLISIFKTGLSVSARTAPKPGPGLPYSFKHISRGHRPLWLSEPLPIPNGPHKSWVRLKCGAQNCLVRRAAARPSSALFLLTLLPSPDYRTEALTSRDCQPEPPPQLVRTYRASGTRGLGVVQLNCILHHHHPCHPLHVRMPGLKHDAVD